MRVYNTGNANNIEPLFVMKVDDINMVEGCIKNIAKEYYTYFFDQSQQNCFYQLVVEKMNNLNLKQIIHCSGFDINIPFNSLHIKSFNDVMISNPGNINHLDLMGNQIVYNYVNSQFDTVNKEKIC